LALGTITLQNLSYIKKTKGALGLWCPTPKFQLYQENQRSVTVMVPNAKISLISRKPKERYGYGAQRQNLTYIKKTKGALWLWCPTPKSQLYQENQRSVRVMVPNAKISVISRKSKER
jgi:alanine-alpha-ketoisovalerate/valine-pyruvate aminotransferase